MFTSVRSRRTAARLVLGLQVALVSVACGGGGGGSGGDDDPPPTGPNPPTQPTPAVTSATVAMMSVAGGGGDPYGTPDEHKFAPTQVTLKRGGTVTWTNETDISHNVTFAAVAGAPANVATHSSGSNTRTFATTGTFAYQCTNHQGMAGTITVVN